MEQNDMHGFDENNDEYWPAAKGLNIFQILNTHSIALKILNFTSKMVYMIDGSGHDPQLIPPIITQGGATKDMPYKWIGHIILVRSRVRECIPDGFNSDGCDWDNITWEIVATPPQEKDKFDGWIKEIDRYNMVVSSNPKYLAEFVTYYESYYRYCLKTIVATQFENSVHYGIMNCTKNILYQIDDSASYYNLSPDIFELYPIPDTVQSLMIPLWRQQKADNYYNIDRSKEYIRIYRYGTVRKNGEPHGHMRERALYIEDGLFNKEGILYIPEYQVCLFKTKYCAQQFIIKYGSVETYQRSLLINEFQMIFENELKKHISVINEKNNQIIIGCGVLLSLQTVLKVGAKFFNKSGIFIPPQHTKEFIDDFGIDTAAHDLCSCFTEPSFSIDISMDNLLCTF